LRKLCGWREGTIDADCKVGEDEFIHDTNVVVIGKYRFMPIRWGTGRMRPPA
jgi:hypothetical protein